MRPWGKIWTDLVDKATKNSMKISFTNSQASEDAAFWVRSRAVDAVTAAHLDAPIKKMDEAAARGLEHFEQRRVQVMKNN